MKGHLTKAVIARRRPLYTAAYTAALSPSAAQFFDSAYSTPSRLGPVQPKQQQPKSQSDSQPTTSLALATNPLPLQAPSPGSSRSPPNAGATIPPLFFPSQFAQSPAFFPSILHATDRAPNRPVYRLDSGAYGIPKPRSPWAPPPTTTGPLDLSVQVGDDSYFIRPNALGVADGVGGWAAKPHGNSALFSRRLMHFCSHEISLLYPPLPSPPSNPSFLTPAAILAPLPYSLVDPDPVTILQRSYERTLEQCKLDGTLGSSTALLAILLTPPTSPFMPQLRIAHVGDCLISLIRHNELVFRSSEQQHKFNYPYQLGPQSATTPVKDAFRIDLAVQEGDIIVVASDGMGDNLWDEDVLEEAKRWGEDVRGMSEALAKRAFKVSETGADSEETPFARRAYEEKKNHVGGKIDDISVLVAVIEGCPDPRVCLANVHPPPLRRPPA